MSLPILFHFLCAQHVSDINISIIRSFRLFCWITTLVVLFLVRFVLEFRCGSVGEVSVLQAEAHIFMSETCWAHKKWNKIANDIKLVFYSSIRNKVGPRSEYFEQILFWKRKSTDPLPSSTGSHTLTLPTSLHIVASKDCCTSQC